YSSVSCNPAKNGTPGTNHTGVHNCALPISCTFTNHRLPQLKLAKTTDPTSDSGTFDLSAGAQTFTNTGAGYGNGQDTGFHNVPQGSLTVSEIGRASCRVSV